MTTQQKIEAMKGVIELLELAHKNYTRELDRIARHEHMSDADFSDYSDFARLRREVEEAIKLCNKVISMYNTELINETIQDARKRAGRTLQGRLSRAMEQNTGKHPEEQRLSINEVLRNYYI